MRKFFKPVAAVAVLSAAVFFYLQYQPETVDESDKPDFASFQDVNEKKKAFFDYIRRGVESENQRVSNERAELLDIQFAFNERNVSSSQLVFAKTMAEQYKQPISSDELNQQWFDAILKKVNVLPEALVLTQAANESAWGTSRFAVDANNYFGQWCYTKGCGLVPLKREEGATHEVALFDSPEQSVNAYFMNVNRNGAYKELRAIRARLQTENKSLTDPVAATALTNGLLRYSERGQDYVDDLQAMIRVNKKFWSAGSKTGS